MFKSHQDIQSQKYKRSDQFHQYHRQTEPPIYKIKLNLRTNIKMGNAFFYVTSCLILPNKYFMILSYNKPSLSILKDDGSHDRDINVPYYPYDVTIIDDQRVAVSYGRRTCISIINYSTHDTNQTLENLCKNWIWSITYNDGNLYIVAFDEGIKVIDLDGNIIKTIRICDNARGTTKIKAKKDKIYYSVNPGIVHCVAMEGKKIWTCQDDRLLYEPAIAVDDFGITVATGYKNNLLMAISPDGNQQKVLLTGSDELQNPNAVFYDKYSKRLLVCNNNNGHAALYDVIY